MADWPATLPGGGGRLDFASGVSAATSVGGTTVAGAVAENTKGAWVELTAATAADCNQMSVLMAAASAFDHLTDIAVGASGSEVALLSNLLFARANSTSNGNFCYTFPVKIPAGTRIAARNQCKGTASGLTRVQLLLASGNFHPHIAGTVATYGANTADSGGTRIDPGATINTKGPWYEITGATSSAIKGALFSLGQEAISSRSAAMEWLIDLGVGAAGSETVLLSDYGVLAYSGTAVTPQPSVSPLLPVDIPAGSRIAMRCQCSSNATNRWLDAILYGVS